MNSLKFGNVSSGTSLSSERKGKPNAVFLHSLPLLVLATGLAVTQPVFSKNFQQQKGSMQMKNDDANGLASNIRSRLSHMIDGYIRASADSELTREKIEGELKKLPFLDGLQFNFLKLDLLPGEKLTEAWKRNEHLLSSGTLNVVQANIFGAGVYDYGLFGDVKLDSMRSGQDSVVPGFAGLRFPEPHFFASARDNGLQEYKTIFLQNYGSESQQRREIDSTLIQEICNKETEKVLKLYGALYQPSYHDTARANQLKKEIKEIERGRISAEIEQNKEEFEKWWKLNEKLEKLTYYDKAREQRLREEIDRRNARIGEMKKASSIREIHDNVLVEHSSDIEKAAREIIADRLGTTVHIRGTIAHEAFHYFVDHLFGKPPYSGPGIRQILPLAIGGYVKRFYDKKSRQFNPAHYSEFSDIKPWFGGINPERKGALDGLIKRVLSGNNLLEVPERKADYDSLRPEQKMHADFAIFLNEYMAYIYESASGYTPNNRLGGIFPEELAMLKQMSWNGKPMLPR